MPPRTRTAPPDTPEPPGPADPGDLPLTLEEVNRNVLICTNMVEQLITRVGALVEAVNTVGAQQQFMTESAIASQTQLANALRGGGLGGILKMVKGLAGGKNLINEMPQVPGGSQQFITDFPEGDDK